MKKLFVIAAAAVLGVSCVSTKTYNTQRAEAMRLASELDAAKLKIDDMSERNTSLSEQLDIATQDKQRLENECADLKDRYKKLLADGSAEAARMLRQLEENQSQLAERSQRVEELEQLLKAREEAIENIRRKVADALLGFEGKGLTISTRNGNVYVSMDNKLLFESGKFDIAPEGAEAVRELANVLAQNTDINVMVEGHTDDVAYRANGQLQDNLDLSVKRATTVTRLLLENKGIDPSRIISAGRGEYLPIDAAKTSEARAKNRRTEIILTPKLDELLSLMDK